MASRVIQAEAIITAKDATGGAFREVAQKVQQLSSTMKSLGGAAGTYGAGMNKTIGRLQSLMSTMAPIASGAAAFEGMRGLHGIIHETVQATAGRAHERARMEAAGFSGAELQEAEKISQEISERDKARSTTTIMHSLRNLRAIVGSFDEAAKLIDPIAQLRIVTLGAHPERKEELESAFDKLEKSQELVGATQDPERFHRNMDLVAKAMNVFGDTMRPDDFYDFAKYSRRAGQGYSDRFLLGVAPTLMQDMGGKSAGEAMSSFYQQFVAGVMPAYVANIMNKNGLIGDPSKLEYTKAGMIKKVLPGAVKGYELAKSDPYRWVNEVLLPTLAAHGVKTKEQIENFGAILGSKRTTGQALGIMSTQQSRIGKDLAQEEGAKGLIAWKTFMAKDPFMAMEGVTDQLQNLMAVAGGPLAEPAAHFLNELAGSIDAIINATKGHPWAATGLVAGGTAALGAGSLAATMYGIGKAFNIGKALVSSAPKVVDLSGDAAIRAMQGLPGAAGPSLLGTVGAAAMNYGLGPLGFLLGSTRPLNEGEGRGAAGGVYPHFTLDDIRALGASPTAPAAEVKGNADLNVNVQVEPSDSFIARLVSELRNGINAFGGGTAGSTGLSMPEAMPGP